MALLNYILKYENIKNKLEIDYRLYFTADRHIHLNGVDYLPWGNNTIDAEYLTTSESTDSDDILKKSVWTAYTIKDYISKMRASNDAMVFKGSIAKESSTSWIINGTSTNVTTITALIGDTYRITKADTYAGNTCEIGDLLICYRAGTGIDSDSDSSILWTVVQTNINGTVIHTINGINYTVYSPNAEDFNIYAPTKAGNIGLILVSTGSNAPEWKSITDLSTSFGTLTAGNGLILTNGYNPASSGNKTISLLIAGINLLGGVLLKESTENKETISIDDNGYIYLTRSNIENALGAALDNMTNSWRNILVNNTEILDKNPEKALNITTETTSGLVINGTDEGIVSFALNLGYTSTPIKRALQVDDTTGKLFVEIPEISEVSTTEAGLAPQIKQSTNLLLAGYLILANKKDSTSAEWYLLDTNMFNRDITINDTVISNSNSIKFQNTDNIKVIASTDNGVTTVSASLSWAVLKEDGNIEKYVIEV